MTSHLEFLSCVVSCKNETASGGTGCDLLHFVPMATNILGVMPLPVGLGEIADLFAILYYSCGIVAAMPTIWSMVKRGAEKLRSDRED